MNTSVRLLLDVVVRSVVLVALTEGVAATYAANAPDDDGLATGLTAMFALACAAALWGVWDGFHRSPGRLCVTWVATGVLVTVGVTGWTQLESDSFSWSVLAGDLGTGLWFWAGLVAAPAIVCGIVQSATGRRGDARHPVVGSRV